MLGISRTNLWNQGRIINTSLDLSSSFPIIIVLKINILNIYQIKDLAVSSFSFKLVRIQCLFSYKKKLPCNQLDLRTSQMTAFKTGGPRSPVEDVKIVYSISTFVINT